MAGCGPGFFPTFVPEYNSKTICTFMDNSIKNLVFDFGGVLIDIDRRRCVEAFQALGFGPADALIGKYQQAGVFREFELGNISSEVFCQSIRNEAGTPVEDSQIIEAWGRMLVGIAPEKLEKLLSLRARYKVYLLSNTNMLHWNVSRPMFACGGHSVDDYSTIYSSPSRCTRTNPTGTSSSRWSTVPASCPTRLC